MAKFSPLLADRTLIDPDKHVKYPAYASYKLDGIRALIWNNKLVSRSLINIANNYTRKTLEAHCIILHKCDGELIAGKPTGQDVMQRASSAFNSIHGEPDFTYYIFDIADPTQPYDLRFRKLLSLEPVLPSYIKIVPQIKVENADALRKLENIWVTMGYEGAIVRKIDGHYKFGRSSLKEGLLLKLKGFEPDEAEIIDFEESYENTNEAQMDELGHTKRSSHKAGMVGKGILGAFVCKSPLWPDVPSFNVGNGPGLTLDRRKEFWENKEKYRHWFCKYKFQKVGSKNRPRLPKFIAVRSPDDM
jgi:DNA ligase-1